MARCGSCSRDATARAIASGLSGGTRRPLSPASTMAGMSPIPVVTTGSPEAKASRMETGWLSMTDELTKMSALS